MEGIYTKKSIPLHSLRLNKPKKHGIVLFDSGRRGQTFRWQGAHDVATLVYLCFPSSTFVCCNFWILWPYLYRHVGFLIVFCSFLCLLRYLLLFSCFSTSDTNVITSSIKKSPDIIFGSPQFMSFLTSELFILIRFFESSIFYALIDNV